MKLEGTLQDVSPKPNVSGGVSVVLKFAVRYGPKVNVDQLIQKMGSACRITIDEIQTTNLDQMNKKVTKKEIVSKAAAGKKSKTRPGRKPKPTAAKKQPIPQSEMKLNPKRRSAKGGTRKPTTGT